MARAVVATGSAGNLILEANENGNYDIGGNWSDVSWALYLEERVTSNSTWSGGGISFTVGQHNIQQWSSGTFGFDWRGAGNQTQLIASGTNRVGHDSNGGGTLTVGATIGSTGTSGAGGPTTITVDVPLTLLRAVPVTPTGLSAARVNDGQVSLSWANVGGTNANPTQNQYQAQTPGGDQDGVFTVGATNGATIAILTNQKKQYRVRAGNEAGWSAWSDWSNSVYTSPAAPSNVKAAKNSGTGIVVTFDSNVGYPEFNHEVWHGIDDGSGNITWDGSALATLSSTARSYTHTTPDLTKLHRYRVRAKQGTLYSGYVSSGTVQLAAPPNKPTLKPQPANTDRATETPFTWTHNPVDTSPQTAYELRRNWNGGLPANGTSTGKVVGTDNTWTIGAGTSNSSVSVQVRTWGSATTGGSDGTGASDWSDIQTVNFRNKPTTQVTDPANAGDVINSSTVAPSISFAQNEGATFVKAQLELRRSSSTGTLLETEESTSLNGIQFDTALTNGTTYAIRARVLDSNGLWSNWTSRTFSVSFLAPPTPTVTLTYLPDSGAVQVYVLSPDPGSGDGTPATITITRRINSGTSEDVVRNYPFTTDLNLLDTVASVNGSNAYTVAVATAQGATARVTKTLVTKELRRAFLGRGTGYSQMGVFGGDLEVTDTVSVASTTVEAAGRVKPVGLYGVETSTVIKVSSTIFENFGSSPDQLRDLLLVPGKACYRDPSGRRVFGTVKGSVRRRSQGNAERAELSFTFEETS